MRGSRKIDGSEGATGLIQYALSMQNVVAVLCDSVRDLPPSLRSCAGFMLVAPSAISSISSGVMWFDLDAETFGYA